MARMGQRNGRREGVGAGTKKSPPSMAQWCSQTDAKF
jgi:hypothetical protein